MSGQPTRRALLVLTGLLAIAAACDASDLLGPNAPQGISGIALLGPLCPVQTETNPCPDRPYEVWVQVRTEWRQLVTRFRTGEDGQFQVGLRPGRYIVVPESGDPFPAAGEQDVEVSQGAYTEIVINFDTGIR